MQCAVVSSKDNLKFTAMTSDWQHMPTDGHVFIEARIGVAIGVANHFLVGFKGYSIR